MEEFTTTFWLDFSIADRFGKSAIRDTFNRAFEEWKTDYRYLTDLVIVLNHKIWEWYDKDHEHPYARLYDELYWKAKDYADENLKGDEFQYYWERTD